MADWRDRFVPVTDRTNDVPEMGIGVLGYGFMGKAHSNGYQRVPFFFWPPVARPRLVAICGRTEKAVAEAALRYGFGGYYTNWRDMVQDERVQVFDNSASADVHAEPCIAAARAGKHVLCEKPLALTAADARAMWVAAEDAGVKHMTGFNYRFIPAVRLARDLIQNGELGDIYHFRGRWLYEGGDDPNRSYSRRHDRSQGGYGALGNIGVHIIDLARFLAGEIESVGGITATFTKERPLRDRPGEMREVTIDDAFAASVKFTGGAVGTLEASTVATGRKQNGAFEINGSKGSVIFELERMNELKVCLRDGLGERTSGFTEVLVTERSHPFYRVWWPAGHTIGWEHTFVHEVEHLIRAVVKDEDIQPLGATFEDGYRAAVVAEAILESNASGKRIEIRGG